MPWEQEPAAAAWIQTEQKPTVGPLPPLGREIKFMLLGFFLLCFFFLLELHLNLLK